METEFIAILKDGAAFRWPASRRSRWHMAHKLPRAGQYSRVAELIDRAQLAAQRAGNVALADVLAAAREICLACEQSRAEAEWHWQAYEKAIGRERELRPLLLNMLDLVVAETARDAVDGEEQLLTGVLAKLGKPEDSAEQAAESAGLWERVRHFILRESGPSAATEPLVAQVAEPATSAGAESETPAARSAKGVIECTPRAMTGASTPPKTVCASAALVAGRAGLTAVLPAVNVNKQEKSSAPSLLVYCLGAFRVYQDHQPVSSWPSSKGKSIFKYLVMHRGRPVHKEVLMELFWPCAEPDAARNSLNVAIYGLRQALRDARPNFHHVLFENDCYLFNPELKIWVDAEEFVDRVQAAQDFEKCGALDRAIQEYEAAQALYQGEFLEEDRYDDWLLADRQALKDAYVDLLDRLSRHYLYRGHYVACANACNKMLAVDACCENAHRRLMRCYSRQGQRYLALRQYYSCVEILREELDVPPMEETVALYHRIRNGESV